MNGALGGWMRFGLAFSPEVGLLGVLFVPKFCLLELVICFGEEKKDLHFFS